MEHNIISEGLWYINLMFSCLLHRPHPYIFFNQDKLTATFVGFTVTDGGDLLDPRTNEILEKCIVEKALRPTMKMLKFNENYQLWLVAVLLPFQLLHIIGFYNYIY